jgi:polyhydroxyalkanoate synthase
MTPEGPSARAWARLIEALGRRPEAWRPILEDWSDQHQALWKRLLGETNRASSPADARPSTSPATGGPPNPAPAAAAPADADGLLPTGAPSRSDTAGPSAQDIPAAGPNAGERAATTQANAGATTAAAPPGGSIAPGVPEGYDAGAAERPVADLPPVRDRRFADPAWSAHPWFDYLRRAYLLGADCARRMVEAAGLPPEEQRRARFFVEQWLDATAPSNFPGTNPEVLAQAAGSGGESVARGLRRLAADLARGSLTMTDEQAFEVGRDLATTPGVVVDRTEIAELIHYRPQRARVRARPLLIVPPFINRYYILDLQAHNSFVRYALEQGLDVYLVSWRNVPEPLGRLSWTDYATEGVLRPLAIARDLSGSPQVNALGFCVGGTLLATALALAAGRGEHPVASVTLLTTMLDFSDVGEIGAYIDEGFVAECEQRHAGGGIVDGRSLALTFATLRANELLWRNVVEHYLKGREPEAFDLLYWNADGTNLPGVLYAWYLRNLYHENRLREPGALALGGVPLDLRAIRASWYLLAAEDDHIVPWQTAWRSARLLRGPRRFALAASGHIAGVINPAARNRRHHRAAPLSGAEPQAWHERNPRRPGSWWSDWAGWIGRRSGAWRTAPAALDSAAHRALEPAPGRYVRERHVPSAVAPAEAAGRTGAPERTDAPTPADAPGTC